MRRGGTRPTRIRPVQTCPSSPPLASVGPPPPLASVGPPPPRSLRGAAPRPRRNAAAGDLPAASDSRLGVGPWPVQRSPQAPRGEPRIPDDRAAAGGARGARARTAAQAHQANGQGRYDYPPAGGLRSAGSDARYDDDRGSKAPPRPVRAFAPSSEFAPSSPFAPSPAFGSPRFVTPPAPSAPRAPAPAPLSAPVAPAAPPLSESDELFRAWQGSVAVAASRRTPWSARRPARGRRAGRGARVAGCQDRGARRGHRHRRGRRADDADRPGERDARRPGELRNAVLRTAGRRCRVSGAVARQSDRPGTGRHRRYGPRP